MHHKKEVKRVSRWFDGGVSSAVAIFITQPIDLLKVQLQIQREGEKKNICQLLVAVLKERGILGLYSGVVGAMLRQLTYSTARFAVYERLKIIFDTNNGVALALMAIPAGIIGSYIGNPFDVVAVRMQADSKLPPEERRNYKTILHGFYQVIKYEGCLTLFSGVTSATLRSILMTMGQMVVYDQMKLLFLNIFDSLKDDLGIHSLAGTISGVIATILTQPMDVVKTRMMHAEAGKFAGVCDCVKQTMKEGPLAFYKGLFPSLIRVTPNVILIHIMREGLRIRFGIIVEEEVTRVTDAANSTTVASSASAEPPSS